jgi:hypothetical protein
MVGTLMDERDVLSNVEQPLRLTRTTLRLLAATSSSQLEHTALSHKDRTARSKNCLGPAWSAAELVGLVSCHQLRMSNR